MAIGIMTAGKEKEMKDTKGGEGSQTNLMTIASDYIESIIYYLLIDYRYYL